MRLLFEPILSRFALLPFYATSIRVKTSGPGDIVARLPSMIDWVTYYLCLYSDERLKPLRGQVWPSRPCLWRCPGSVTRFLHWPSQRTACQPRLHGHLWPTGVTTCTNLVRQAGTIPRLATFPSPQISWANSGTHTKALLSGPLNRFWQLLRNCVRPHVYTYTF